MKLIEMTDFVLEQKIYRSDSEDILQKIVNYAKFLKIPLTLGMFIPCDDGGNALKEPTFDSYMQPKEMFKQDEVYQKAKEKVLFEGFRFENNKLLCRNDYVGLDVNEYSNIEELQNDDCYEIILTESAIKQIGL